MRHLELKQVSDFRFFLHHRLEPYKAVAKFFHDGDPIIVTELIRALPIVIGKDRRGTVIVTTAAHAHKGLTFPEFRNEKWGRRVSRWLKGGQRERNVLWQAASDIVGYLKNWPPTGEDIQAFGYLTHEKVLLERVVIDGKTRGYRTYFGEWVPQLSPEKWDEDQVLPLARGTRPGIVIRHLGMKVPLFAYVLNPLLENYGHVNRQGSKAQVGNESRRQESPAA